MRTRDQRPRLLSEQCATCIYRPGNLMHLAPGRLKEITESNLREGSRGLICHDTLPYGAYPEYGEAMCRGFYDKFGPQSNYVRIIDRLGGFAEVPPPEDAQ
jgi:hypothetical protein